MKLALVIGVIIGFALIIYSILQLLKLKNKIKTKATIIGFHSYMGRSSVTRVEFEVNGVKRECDLHYYSLLMKKGKNITIFYNPNKYWDIDCIEGNVFTLILGTLFFIASIYGILN